MIIAESKCANRYCRFFKSRILKLNQRFNCLLLDKQFAPFFVGLDKHPNIRGEEGKFSIALCHLNAPYKKRGEKVRLIFRIMGFNKVAELCIHAATSHVRRVCHHHVVLLLQHDRLLRQHGQQRLGPLHPGHQLEIALNGAQLLHQAVSTLQAGDVHLQDGAVLLGVMEGADQLIGRLQTQCIHGKLALQALEGLQRVALLNGHHMGLNAPGEEAPVVLAGLHHHGKIGQLRGAVVDVQAVEVVFDNALHGLPGGIAVGLVNLHQHVKQIHQNVSAAHTGIDAADVLGLELGIALADLRQLRLHLGFLLRLGEVVFPGGLEGVVRVALHPQAAQAVFHHVAHDPVRREQLRGGGNVVLADLDVLLEVGKHLILGLGVVILVQPADDLHLIEPVLLGDEGDHLLDDAALAQQVVREEQLGTIRNLLEHAGQDAAQRVALGDEQILEQRLVVALFLAGIDLLHIQAVQLQVDRLGENLGLKGVLLIGEHAHAGGQVAVDLHKAQGNEAVEPGIGHFLHDLLIAVLARLLNAGDEALTLGLLGGGEQAAVHMVGADVAVVLFGDAVLLRLLGHAGNQLAARPDGKLLDGVLVHGESLLTSGRCRRCPSCRQAAASAFAPHRR